MTSILRLLLQSADSDREVRELQRQRAASRAERSAALHGLIAELRSSPPEDPDTIVVDMDEEDADGGAP